MNRLFMNHTLVLCLALTASMLSCARDYEDDINAASSDMEALVQADKDLRAHLAQSIAEARTRLNQMLSSEDETLKGEISGKVDELKNSINAKMAALLTLMETRFSESEQRAQQKLDELDNMVNGAGGTKELLQQHIDATRTAVLNAQEGHNTNLAAKLSEYDGKLTSLKEKLGKLTETAEALKAQFEVLKATDFKTQLAAMQTKVEDLEAYGLEQKLDEMQASLAQFTEEQFAEMTTDDLDKLNAYYADLVKYSGQVLGKYSQWEDDLEQWEQTFNTLEGDYNAAVDGLSEALGKIAYLDDVLTEGSTVEAINDVISEIEGYESDVENYISEMETITDDCRSAIDACESEMNDDTDWEAAKSNAETYSALMDDQLSNLLAWIDDLQNRYPWWEW
ncbi:MAG: hypothetical protein IJR24_05630 [Alloprevotella sp.]|nr:hypothetical protein [Alloprevotella sp.]